MAEFHFLRPIWLLLVLPVCLLAWLAWRETRSGAGWRAVIDADLLPYLLEGGHSAAWQRQQLALLAGALIAVLALAGPAWQKLPSPLERRLDLQIVLFDLSLSMYAQDVKPSRLQRARYKLQDFLQQREEGQTALIAYAGDAFVVTPFTDDQATVLNQVRALDPMLMPAPGSNLPAALREAEGLLREQDVRQARLLVMTDEIRPGQLEKARGWSRKTGLPLDILAVGTRSGAPIPLPDGDFARDGMGKLVTPGVNVDEMRSLAQATGGRFQVMRPDDADIVQLREQSDDWNPATAAAAGRQADTYRDAGPWLALLLLPIAASMFRRGILMLAACVLLPIASPPAQAIDWESLWKNPDQRGLQAFRSEDFESASERFEDPEWRASALYRAGRHREAIQHWQALDTPRAHYNRGNALAHSGDLQGALEAYDRALAEDPEHADARANRALVEELLQQQSRQQEQSPGGGDSQQTESSRQQSGQSSEDGDAGERHDAEQSSEGSRDDAEDDGQQQSSHMPPESEPREQSEQTASGDEDAGAGNTPESLAGQEAEQPGEHDQALEQWLRRIPDDPSALLRRKFLWQYQQRAGDNQAIKDGEAYW